MSDSDQAREQGIGGGGHEAERTSGEQQRGKREENMAAINTHTREKTLESG